MKKCMCNDIFWNGSSLSIFIIVGYRESQSIFFLNWKRFKIVDSYNGSYKIARVWLHFTITFLKFESFRTCQYYLGYLKLNSEKGTFTYTGIISVLWFILKFSYLAFVIDRWQLFELIRVILQIDFFLINQKSCH